MLKRIEVENLGPAPEMALELQPRLNLITGDNGLGKSFLLDAAWWALTWMWPRNLDPERFGFGPHPTDAKKGAHLRFELTTDAGTSERYESKYVGGYEQWSGAPGRPWSPALVIHARADGGFSVWDPARNSWREQWGEDTSIGLPDYHLSPWEVLTGVEVTRWGVPMKDCNGVLDDWSGWIREKDERADRMAELVGALSGRGEPLEVGRVRVVRPLSRDPQRVPTIKTGNSGAVPIIYAPSALRRMIGLAYLLVWGWYEHRRAAEELGMEAAAEVILLMDEIEAHLHPRQQRVISPAIFKAIDDFTGRRDGVQLIATTHSPLVLASMEPHFDEERDQLLHLGVRDGRVQVETVRWAAQGDVVNWLVSEVFGLRQARSVEAERAIDAAEAYMRGDAEENPVGLRDAEAIDQELRRVVAGHDEFWPRWILWTDRQGGGA